MKRIFLILTAAALAFSLAACGPNPSTTKATTDNSGTTMPTTGITTEPTTESTNTTASIATTKK